MKTSGKARCAGIMGWPVGHSLSPRLHAAWLAAHDIDGVYVPLPVRREDFAVVVRGLQRAGFRGFNLTIPHKEAGFALADSVDETARMAGAVNLLVFQDDGRITGRNTDAPGLAASLREAKLDLAGGTAVLLGAGGAARAAVLALDGLGVAAVHILNRDPARAVTLAAALRQAVKARLEPAGLQSWPEAAGRAQILIHATSAGMTGQLPLDLPLDPLPAGAAVCDLVYNPLETALLKRARGRGLVAVDGLGMLLHQAVPSFEAFYGVTPKITPALRRELEEALHGGR